MSLASIRSCVAAANQHVNDLCTGKARWTMRVPVDLERDSDVVISSALVSAEALLAVADAAEKVTDEHYLLHTDYGECRWCRRDDGHDGKCLIGALLVALADLEALP